MNEQQRLDKRFKIVFWICIVVYILTNSAVFYVTYGGNK